MSESTKHDQFAEHFVRNQHRIFAFIVTLVGNRADAEEVFQQTSLTIWRKWESFDTSADFVRWACGIAHNHARNHFRKEKRASVLLDKDVLEQLSEEAPASLTATDARLPALRLCLQELSKRSRETIESYYLGKSVEAMAKERLMTRNAMYKTLRRIRQALHDCIMRKMADGGAS